VWPLSLALVLTPDLATEVVRLFWRRTFCSHCFVFVTSGFSSIRALIVTRCFLSSFVLYCIGAWRAPIVDAWMCRTTMSWLGIS
jgi:hypothetical protein